jgi:hypothetical protein
MNTRVVMAALAVAIVTGAAGARAQDVQAEAPKVVTKTLVKSEAQKECFKLVNTQVLYYRFNADAPVDFKLSSQEEKEIVHVVRKAADGAGNFVSKKTAEYCLVWTSGGERATTLHYELQRGS